MIAEDRTKALFTRERVLTFILALATLIAIYVCYLIIQPFIPAIAFALALAVATRRPFTWLRNRLHCSDTLAAGIATALVAFLIIVPAVLLVTYVLQSAMDNVGSVQNNVSGASILEHLQQIPIIGPYATEYADKLKIEEHLGTVAQMIASRAGAFVSHSVDFITELVVTLFVLFFLYRDRRTAMAAVRAALPLSNTEADDLFDRLSDTISATVNGSLTIALLQATLATTVYVLLGVPGAVLCGVATFFLAFIPFGTVVVWVSVALYLGLTGHIGKAIFVVVWSGVVVSSIDNFVYPYLVGGKLRLHTVPTFFSVVGGVALFGPSGLILGPMTVAVTMALVDVWFERTKHGRAAEEAVTHEKSPPSVRPSAMVQEK